MEPELIVMDDDDDDLVILEERPAPPKPPPDLVMDCVDERIDLAQRLKHSEDTKAFRKTMKLVKAWSLKPRMQTQRRNTIVMGTKKKTGPDPPGVPLIVPLTRPPQPFLGNGGSRALTVSQSFISARPGPSPPIQFSNFNNRTPPISIIRQRAVAPRGKILVRPNTTMTMPRAMPNILGHSGTPFTGTISRSGSLTGGTSVSNSQIALADGQVLNLNFQPLLFDTTLIMQNPGMSTSTVSITGDSPTFTKTNQIRATVGSGIISNPATRGMLSLQRPSVSQVRPRAPVSYRPAGYIVSQVPSLTPKIVSTSSLSDKSNRPNSSGPVRYPPAKPTGINRPRTNSAAPARTATPNRTSTVAGTRPPVPPGRSVASTVPGVLPTPARGHQLGLMVRASTPILNRPSTPTGIGGKTGQQLQYLAKPRPASANPGTVSSQIETTNTINGPHGDKDNNNKTFPSLVVVVKPCLGEKISRATLNSARGELDSRVKTLLLHSPAKLTEWLMQQGLLRLEHRCTLHMTPDRENIKYKLGMYSDGGKQPFSGGYVWITECCPDTQTSVFHGSIFESAVYTPGTIMKLIYHWACQTSAQNVLQWVKVSSYYLKNFYTLLRSCCVAALHEYAPMMGGPDKFVEVGIITLGTPANQLNPGQKPIKIEIVGVFDPVGKVVRMKVINPLGGGQSTTTQIRLRHILWPVKTWVDKESTILIDSSIEKHSLTEMGFKSVIQSKNAGGTTQHSNVNVMNYLKHVIPKMFQNTLSVLSKSLIQQFLDELAWRELWGSTSSAAFDCMINHLVQMTKWELDETLISRLNKISLNPFAEWSYSKGLNPTGIDMLPDSIRGVGSGMPTLESYAAYVETNGYSSSGPDSPGASNTTKELSENGTSKPPTLYSEISNGNQALKRKADSMSKDELRQFLNLKMSSGSSAANINMFGYYYAESKNHSERVPLPIFPTHLKCSLCNRGFLTNQEVVKHITTHIKSVGRISNQCTYCEFCLHESSSQSLHTTHVTDVHRQDYVAFPCYICQDSFPNKTNLILHMWQTHDRLEMPYRCDCCGYKNSRHHEVVEHFHKEHVNTDQVLCPICLKVYPARSAADIQTIVVHLQSHAGKKGKKCSQCLLTFATDMDMRAHGVSGAHNPPLTGSNYATLRSVKDKEIMMPAPPPKMDKVKGWMPPPAKKSKGNTHLYQKTPLKPKGNEKPKPPHLAHLEKGALYIESMTFYIHKDEDPDEVYNCCECKSDVLAPYHFPGCLTCAKCPFSTSCEKSMWAHNRNNHQVGRAAKGVGSMQTNLCKDSIRCECGQQFGNSKASSAHLVQCGNHTGKVIRKEARVTNTKTNHDTIKLGSDEFLNDETGILSGLGLRPK